ncbi:MAG: ABC transporter permease, partial [Phaeodactylibacter sp.]|nr:ABC transporter permease [Phaeodactylibacter sp.]
MKIEYFIARRVAASGQRSFSRLIIRLAALAIALSMTVMIVATALITGFKNQISKKIFGFWGHIHISDTNINQSLLESNPVRLDQDFYPSLDTIRQVNYLAYPEFAGIRLSNNYTVHTTKAGIDHIQGFALKPGIIETKEEIEGIILKGIGRDFNWDFMAQYLQEGEALDLSGDKMSNGILISRQTADRLNLSVGDKFIVYFVQREAQLKRAFQIEVIYKTGLEEYDRKFALVDIRKIQQLLGWSEQEVAGFEVFIENLDDLDIYEDYIYSEVLPPDMFAESIRKKFPNIFEWLELQNINEKVILALMLVVGIINMVTALMILILERTNMIGILKALGARNWSIRKVFLYYAAYIIGIGLFWGNVIGLGLCWL